MRKLLLLLLVLSPLALTAQYNLLFLRQDTVTYKFRTGGQGLDSLDRYFSPVTVSTPGGGWNNLFGRNHSDYLNVLPYFQKGTQLPGPLTSYFTGLPHLGFMYSFGSGGTQYVHADYQQTFRKNTNLSITYDKNSLGFETGFVRNNSYNNNAIQVLADHKSKRYEALYYLNYLSSNRLLSGGIRTDTLIDRYGLIYTPVNKERANSLSKNLQLGTQHQFNLNRDSLIRHGISYRNEWSIENRVYREQDSLDKLYPVVHFDSLTTRDQYQLASIRNAGGYFLKTDFMQLEALVEHRYWKYQNLAKYRDTNELKLVTSAGFKLGKVRLQNYFDFNFTGAIGEITEKANAEYKSLKWHHQASFELERRLPSVFQRGYIGNNAIWNLTDPSLQTTTALNYRISWLNRYKMTANVGWKNLKNNYFYTGENWRNDTLSSINIVSASIRGTFTWKTITAQPFITYNIVPSNFDFIPDLDARVKLFFNKRLFKARKFNYILGIEARYISSYGLVSYQPNVDVYILPSVMERNEAQFKLDFYTGFQIDDFRLYIKAENMDYLWSSKVNQQQLKYSVLPMVIRIGLTWDFFN